MKDELARARGFREPLEVRQGRFEPKHIERHYDGTLNASVGEVWETEGGRLWQIIQFESIFVNAPIVARNVTQGSMTADYPRGFTRDGRMVDGAAKLVKRVL